jgi:hypothetical protein
MQRAYADLAPFSPLSDWSIFLRGHWMIDNWTIALRTNPMAGQAGYWCVFFD